MIKKALFLLSSSWFLSACSTISSDNWWHSQPPEQDVIHQNDADRQAQIRQKLDTTVVSPTRSASLTEQKITQNIIQAGRIALSENRLLTPEGDNANLYFQIALGRDPSNYDATMGLAAIVDKYLAWAVTAASNADMARARQLLASAKQVNANDPTIEEVETRIQLAQEQMEHDLNGTSSGDIFHLPEHLFDMSEEAILAHIQPIIDRVEHTRASIEINWPSDKDGRLLYQIINSRTPEFRVRAMTFHRSEHTVKVLVN